jgi:glycosyltransferase involved in cell wall biosynthesis
MRIGFASEWIGERVGGVERYAADLIRGLVRVDPHNHYAIFTTRRGAHFQVADGGGRVTVRPTAISSRWYYVPVGLPLGLLQHPVDLLHATFTVVPWCPTRRIVLTVHDVGPDVHPEFFPAGVRYRFRWLVKHGLARATRVIVPSLATKEELLEHYPVEAAKVIVIPEGINGTFERHGPEPNPHEEIGRNIPQEFILCVGRFHARKNLVRLLQSFAIVKKRRRTSVKLVMAGSDMWHKRQVTDVIHELALDRDVVCPGYVSDAALDVLYRRAMVFAFPSLHEGFGIPPLEAMARGLPVMASNLSVMPEVLGDAALLVDPYSVEDMADGLEKLLYDTELRQRLIQRGKKRSAQYDWDSVARRTLNVYEEVCAAGEDSI